MKTPPRLSFRHGATSKPLLEDDYFGFIEPIRFTTNTFCWMASITKPITAATAMVDAGKLALDDPVEKYRSNHRAEPTAF